MIVVALCLGVPALAKKVTTQHRSSAATSRIVEGEASSPGWFPWMAALLDREASEDWTSKYDNQFCGGTLVHEQWVLTSALCVDYGPCAAADEVSVLLGATNLKTWFDETFVVDNETKSPEFRRVEAVVLHPAYDPINLNNDVALLRLAAPSTLPPVQLIAGNNRTAFVEQQRQRNESVALGWGDTTDLEQRVDYPARLQYVSVPLVDDYACQEALRSFERNLTFDPYVDDYDYGYGYDFGLDYDALNMSAVVCAGAAQVAGDEVTSDVCAVGGDEGGPLLVRRDGLAPTVPAGGADEWLQVGVISWGVGCADTYSVYADVAAFHAWIAATIAATPSPTATELHPDPIRLVGGSAPYHGRLEIFHEGVWGTVCIDGFLDPSADVVCRQLFDTDASYIGRFGAGNQSKPIWMSSVTCTGSERALSSCCFAGWGVHDEEYCDHEDDVGVACRLPPPTTAPTPVPTVTPAPLPAAVPFSRRRKKEKASSSSSAVLAVVLVCVVLATAFCCGVAGITAFAEFRRRGGPPCVPPLKAGRDEEEQKETELAPVSTDGEML